MEKRRFFAFIFKEKKYEWIDRIMQLSPNPNWGFTFYYIGFIQVCRNQFEFEKYIDIIFSLNYAENNDNFNIIGNLLDVIPTLIEKNLQAKEMLQYKEGWIEKVSDFVIRKIESNNRWNCKESIKNYIMALVKLETSTDKMYLVLKSLFSVHVAKGTFYDPWLFDVVMPLLLDLLPYFSQQYVDYLHKILTEDPFDCFLGFSSLMKADSAKKLPNDEKTYHLLIVVINNIEKQIGNKGKIVPVTWLFISKILIPSLCWVLCYYSKGRIKKIMLIF